MIRKVGSVNFRGLKPSNLKTFLFAAVLGLAPLLASCSSFLSSDGPYQGRVIDRKSKRPVEGAVVLAIWPRESSSITKQTLSPHDVKEALTDKEGNFTVPGTPKFSFDPMVRIKEPVFTIFKPGYETIEQRKLLPLEKERRIVLQLRELTTKEQRLQNLRRLSFANCDREKRCPNLIKLRDLEANYLGLEPAYVEKEKASEGNAGSDVRP